MSLPYASFFSEIRKITRTGNSYGVTLPPSFVKSLETLGDRYLKMINIDNQYIIFFAEKMSHNDLYDLLQLVLTALEVLYHNTENKLIQEELKKIYEKLVAFQHIYE